MTGRVFSIYQSWLRGTAARSGPPGYVWVNWDDGRVFPVSADSIGPESELEWWEL